MAIDVFPNVAKDSKLMVTNAPQSAEMASVTVTVVACLTAAKGYDWTITAVFPSVARVSDLAAMNVYRFAPKTECSRVVPVF